MERNEQSGTMMLALVVVLVPLVLTVGAFTATMASRTDRLSQEIDDERALLAAESGIDYAIWLGKSGAIADGHSEDVDLGASSRFHIEVTHLLVDGVDNDGDGPFDAADADDEDVYQIVATGRYRQTTRRIAAYLGPVRLVPNSYPGAMNLMNPTAEIVLSGTTRITGYNTNMNGSRGAAAADAAGLSVGFPGTTADLLGELSAGEQALVDGPGGPPSLGTGPAMDIATIVAAVQNSADVVLTNGTYGNFNFGSGVAGTTTMAYREGNVRLTGNTTGAGILVVTGDLQMSGNFRFDGVIIVLGSITAGAGTAQVYGAIVQGPAGGRVRATGTFDMHYSAEAIALANATGGRYVAFNGWQELAR